jgi:hypothetical protein
MAHNVLLSTCNLLIATCAFLHAWHPAALYAQSACPPGNLLNSALTVGAADVYEPQHLNDGILTDEGSSWDSSRAAIFQSRRSFIVFDLGSPRDITWATLQGDNNDSFHIEASLDGAKFSTLWKTPTIARPGLQTRESRMNGSATRFIRLSADRGDRFVSASEIALYCDRTDASHSELRTLPGEPRLSPSELRKGAGATFWLYVWGILLLAVVAATIIYRLRQFSSAPGAWISELRNHLRETYLTLDYRTLGLFRISLGLLLIYDLVLWIQSFDLFFSASGLLSPLNEGLGSNALVPFTLLRWSSHDWSTWLFMAFSFLTYVAFTSGYYTRVSQPLAWLCVISIHNVVPMLNNSGHMVIRLLLTWTLLLPLGRRFSIDAVTLSRTKQELTPERCTSILALLLPLQLSAIYFLNVLHKFSEDWTSGRFVALVLQDPSIATALGTYLSQWAPAGMLSAVTILTLAIEAAGPFLLLSPAFSRGCRIVAVVSLVCLHIAIALSMKLAIFSGAMISFLILMLPGDIANRLVQFVLPGVKRRRGIAPERPLDTPATWLRLSSSLAKAALVAVFGLASLSQLIRENEPLSQWFAHRPFKPLQYILTSLNTYQGWCMFATCGNRSNPPISLSLIMEATDSQGRRIDLLRSIFSNKEVPAAATLMSVEEEPSNEQWRMYNRRVAAREPVALKGLSRYLREFPYSRFNVTPPIRIESYSRYQPIFAPEKKYPPLVIRFEEHGLPTFIPERSSSFTFSDK